MRQQSMKSEDFWSSLAHRKLVIGACGVLVFGYITLDLTHFAVAAWIVLAVSLAAGLAVGVVVPVVSDKPRPRRVTVGWGTALPGAALLVALPASKAPVLIIGGLLTFLFAFGIGSGLKVVATRR